MSTFFAIVGRILIAAIFLISGATKLANVSATNVEITAVGLPYGLAVPTGLFEITAGIFLILGFYSRFVSLLLIGFTLLATLYFHGHISDPVQAAMAMKNFAIVGGLFLVMAHKQMWLSYDALRTIRRSDLAAADRARLDEARLREAEARAQKAELRAAGLEGAAPAAPEPVAVISPPAKRRWLPFMT